MYDIFQRFQLLFCITRCLSSDFQLQTKSPKGEQSRIRPGLLVAFVQQTNSRKTTSLSHSRGSYLYFTHRRTLSPPPLYPLSPLSSLPSIFSNASLSGSSQSLQDERDVPRGCSVSTGFSRLMPCCCFASSSSTSQRLQLLKRVRLKADSDGWVFTRMRSGGEGRKEEKEEEHWKRGEEMEEGGGKRR